MEVDGTAYRNVVQLVKLQVFRAVAASCAVHTLEQRIHLERGGGALRILDICEAQVDGNNVVVSACVGVVELQFSY